MIPPLTPPRGGEGDRDSVSPFPTILAIDPGLKCGIAILADLGGRGSCRADAVKFRSIVSQNELEKSLPEWIAKFSVDRVVIGGSTQSETVCDLVKRVAPDIPLYVQDEENTTLEARRRYFSAKPLTGWRRLVPLSLQVPPEPYDDFAAVVVGERYLLAMTRDMNATESP